MTAEDMTMQALRKEESELTLRLREGAAAAVPNDPTSSRTVGQSIESMEQEQLILDHDALGRQQIWTCIWKTLELCLGLLYYSCLPTWTGMLWHLGKSTIYGRLSHLA